MEWLARLARHTTILELEKTFYVPSFSRNLISVSRLVSLGYSFNFSDVTLSLFHKYDLVGYGTLSYGLYCLNLQNNTSRTAIHVHVGTKCCVVNEDSSMYGTKDWDISPKKGLNDYKTIEYLVLWTLLITKLV